MDKHASEARWSFVSGAIKALLIDEDSYLLELVRYTHLNSVRAGMVKRPSEYAWSSHIAYTGDEIIPWLTKDVVLSRFGNTAGKARVGYAEFVMDGLNEGYRSEFHAGGSDVRVLGDDHFAEQALAGELADDVKIGFAECITQVCRYYDVNPEALSESNRIRKLAEARAVVAWLMGKYGDMTLTAIAEYFGRDVATMSTAVRKIEGRMADDEFKKNIEQIWNNIKL